MKKMKITDLLVSDMQSPNANKIASLIGLQVVNRNGKPYVRRIPERLTGKALDSAIKFGEINHNNRGRSGNILLPDGAEQNVVAFESARQMKGNVFVKPITQREKIEQLLED